MGTKKLLYFASDYKIGLSSLLTDQLISLHDAGIDVVAVAGENEQEPGLSKMLEEKGVKITRIDGLDAHSNFRKLANTIQRIVLNNNIDVIHVQNNWQLAIAGIVKNKIRLKRKVSIAYTLHGFRHNSPIKSKIAQVVIGSALFIFANHVICMTKYLKRKFRLLSYKIDLIPLGVNDQYFIPEFISPKTDGLHLIFPAQFREGKNQDMIIRTFAKFVNERDDSISTLTLPGNGPLLEQMKQLVTELGISEQVRFPGFISKKEVKRLYLESNASIVASNSETFGQSIVEPFVLGRCVISTPVGIATEIINSDSGFIFRNEDELLQIFHKISNNPVILQNIGQNNFNKRTTFSWYNITDLYKKSIL